MRFEDIKLGMKVVPHDKTAYRGDSLSYSGIWKECKKANQPYMYVIRTEDSGIVCCSDRLGHRGDFFLASDLTPYEERYTCNIPGVTVELVPGKEYWWVSDYSVREAVCDPIRGKYICTIKGRHYMEMDEHNVCGWKYAVDPDLYKEPETEMTVEEIAEALRKSGVIKGKLKIKE